MSSKVVMTFDDDLPSEAPLNVEFSSLLTDIRAHRSVLESLAQEKFDNYWNFHEVDFADESSLQALLVKAKKKIGRLTEQVPMLSRLFHILDNARKELYLELDRSIGTTEFARGHFSEGTHAFFEF
jgi:hypothetical protein